MPVGSNYRAIDFILSNMTNSNINKIAVITQYNPRSLNDHLSASKWWNLGSKNGGLYVFSPYLSKENSYWYRGTAESIYQNISFLKKSNEEYVIIASGDAISKMDFHDVLNYHIQKDADITIVCKDLNGTGMDPHSFGIMEFDEDMRMINLEEKPVEPQTSIASLGIYVVKRTLLIRLLETAMAEDRHDIVNDIISRYRKKYKIYGYLYDGYWRTLNSVKSYVDVNMDFLKKDIRQKFIFEKPYIMTKPKDEPPVKYNGNADVKNSLIGSGSIINSHVSNSVLFRKVFIGDGSSVVDSIILEGSVIGQGCTVRNAIIDKDVVISDGREIIGTPDEPVIIEKGTVL
jgi:glucose-1-phosphate adenylyltransferase